MASMQHFKVNFLNRTTGFTFFKAVVNSASCPGSPGRPHGQKDAVTTSVL